MGAAKITQETYKKIVYDEKKNAIGLAPTSPNYSLPVSERVTSIPEGEVMKYQRKVQEWKIGRAHV